MNLIRWMLVFAFLSIKQVQAQQQQKDNTIYVTAGTLSRYNVELTAVNSLLEVLFSPLFGTTPQMQHGSQPLICMGYQRKISRNVRVGIEAMRDKFWLSTKDQTYTYSSILVRGDYVWLNTKHTELYSGLGAGISHVNNSYNYNNTHREERASLFGWHLYMIGFGYKLKEFTLTANTGYGASGAINAGVEYSF